ncbi:MAG: ABC transporter ATP-binding protein [Caldilineaceae bacterium]|nr:ABC transporter ATP-binding protein [Caldilineaceae bacterium]
MQATRRLTPFLKPYWRWAVLAPLLMTLEVGMDLLQPRMIQRIIDVGIGQSQPQIVIQTALLMVLFAVIGLVGGAGCTVYAVLAAQGLGADVRQTLFAKIQTLSFGNLDRLETGKLITRLTNDVNQVQEVVMMVLRVMVRSPLLLIGSLIMAVITSPRLALLFVIMIPLVMVGLALIIGRAFPMFEKVQRRLDALNTVMQENLAGVRVVKAFVRNDYEIERFGQANDQLMDQNIAAVRTVAITMPFMMVLMNAGVVAVIWFGGLQVNAGGMHVGQIVAFMNYLTQTLMSLMMVSMLVTRISRAEASAVRIQEVFDSTPEVQQAADAQHLDPVAGRVAFEHVSFRYNGAAGGEALDGTAGSAATDDEVLQDVSFVAEPGQTVALLGTTGAGKSSLVHLIPRFYDVSGGRVTLDGHDVRMLDDATLRGQIGMALQEAILFSGAIRDNIRYGRPDASQEEVEAAAKLAQAHDFIAALPDGYDTLVGQRGVNLSGGQKQRLAIARALLIDPAVLILDDSTSAVDVETEALIKENLAKIRQGRTNVVVAQRISSVLAADNILVLDEGRIAAQGTHAELMASSPIYREIYASQLDPTALETVPIAQRGNGRVDGQSNGQSNGQSSRQSDGQGENHHA